MAFGPRGPINPKNKPSVIQKIVPSPRKTVDGSWAVANVAYRLSEVIAIYPITPSSGMAESCDEWAARGRMNEWGTIPTVYEMQSEGGAAGAFHGALTAGSLSTTFTASQGLLLMIPNLYKIAGELTPFVIHVSARALAAQALSIFGDHSDVMSCRQTGFAMLASNSVQEAQDMAAIAHAATLKSRIPFIHFFDGFRTSHELNTIDLLDDSVLRSLVDPGDLQAFRERGLSPDHPDIRGTAQNPDVFFQCREASNLFYEQCPGAVEEVMARFGEQTGRNYQLFEYYGDPEAETVLVAMGSAGETIEETLEALQARGIKAGFLQVRLYRPFAREAFLQALPDSVRRLVVLDRTKEPGGVGDPLYLDVAATVNADREGGLPPIRVLGGRYGLGSKEFTPAMVQAIVMKAEADELRHGFTVGIRDDVTHHSLEVKSGLELDKPGQFQALFYGLGSDGTVGANKNTIKIIGESTDFFAQAYFVYDSKKSGAMTVSHLRFGPEPVRAPYLITAADFIGVHQFSFLDKFPVIEKAAAGATLLINTPYTGPALWEHLSRHTVDLILEKQLKVWAIDAYRVAREIGMGGRINTIMQTCFFSISGILPQDEALAEIKKSIRDTYARKGESVVEKNFRAVDEALSGLVEVSLPADSENSPAPFTRPREEVPDFVKNVTLPLLEARGDELPVSAFPVDGRWPTGTSKWEKRAIAQSIPIWDPSCCTQCNKCVEVCPHATIRSKFFEDSSLEGAPDSFLSVLFRDRHQKGKQFTVQVAPEDCTGCGLCVEVCPAKNRQEPRFKAINMRPREAHLEERSNWDFFQSIPYPDPEQLDDKMKSAQFREPLFEFSGACGGCGETPYLKLLTQLYGDRLMIANATGCSSIYGGNLPTTPYTTNAEGRGPAWSNSLFEDNAEFGLGMRLGIDQKREVARDLLRGLSGQVDPALVIETLNAPQKTDADIARQRERVQEIREQCETLGEPECETLLSLTDYLVEKSIWIVGGDGWAYDIGFGGLDHVLASDRNVNILVLDTEVYSNTGGQQSKSTPLGAVAKFASSGKAIGKKDLGLLAMQYGHVYVAQISMGGNDTKITQLLREANDYPGPSLVIAYSHCIAHGYSMTYGMEQQKRAVRSGYWPLFHYDPRLVGPDHSGFFLDSKPPDLPVVEFMNEEGRFRMLSLGNPERAKQLTTRAQQWVDRRLEHYRYLTGETTHAAAPVQPEESED